MLRLKRNWTLGLNGKKLKMSETLKILRTKWPNELARFDDVELGKEYAWFKASEYGKDDDRFLEWLVMTDG